MITPATDDVEAFQREAGWIDLAMTTRAALHITVFGELFTDRRGAANVGLNRFTSAGGLGGGVPRMRSSTQEPRMMGEVVVPLAVTFNTLPIVSSPPR